MFLIIAEGDDVGAKAVADVLDGRRVVRVGPRDLATAQWSHRVSGEGVSTVMRWSGGVIQSEALSAVLLRARSVPSPVFANRDDREYAAMELFALTVAWLAALPCPVVNPASGRGLAGPVRSPTEWASLAGRAGLPVRGRVMSTSARRAPGGGGMVMVRANDGWRATAPGEAAPDDRPVLVLDAGVRPLRRLLVAGDEVVGDSPPGLADACLRLSRLAGCPVLEFFFDSGPAGWRLDDVQTLPRLDGPGEAEAVARLLATLAAPSKR